MTEEQRDHLTRLLRRLSGKKKRVGPFRMAGIQRSIDGIREQLKTGVWKHPNEAKQ